MASRKTKAKMNIIEKVCIAGFFVVSLFAFSIHSVAADNTDAITEAIYQRTATQGADSEWTKYIKGLFASSTGITSNASTGRITWADVPDSGVSSPWDGSKLAVTTSLPSVHTPGVSELVAETSTDGSGIKTIKYTKYSPAATPGDPDVATVQLETKTNTTVAGAAPDYHIYTAEALAYVMQQFSSNKLGTAYLEKDIDLNGRNYNWFNVRMVQGQDFNGQNHTIYNLSAINNEKNSTSSRSGFICVADSGCEVTNVDFDTAYIVGTHRCGIVGYMGATSNPNRLENIQVRNVITTISTEQAGSLAGRVEGGSIIKNCSAENCTVFGKDHEGSLTGAVIGKNVSGTMRNAQIENCYSTGCTVYSTGVHSGGLISCGGSLDIKNCFTDVEVYGADKVGVFTGVLNGTCSIEDCFASGFVEGSSNIGGFLGLIEYISGGTDVSITNCYTTALTGLRKGGTRLGGFIGATDNRATKGTIKNCYAAGEVGAIDTDVSAPAGNDYTVDQAQQSGGFIGYQTIENIEYENCYYDKQTTAMREWGVGHRPTGADCSGIKGVLTTDTDKAGNGLVSNDYSDTRGFTKFTEEGASDCWNYSVGEHYPMLAALKNATANEWLTEERAETARAYSLSSTSTMKLDTWDKGLNTETGEMTRDLPETTYCTARDITTGLTLTSKDVEKWERTETQDNTGTGEAKTRILGEPVDVLSLKHENGVWLCDELVPGMEWLRVTCKDGDRTATRRVRVIPTAGLNAGKSAVLQDKYDHADDVELYYSTGTRMAIDIDDITTGIFPDKNGAANTITARQTALMAGKDMSADNDKFRDVNVDYMSEGNDNAKDGKLYTYIYSVNGFDPDTNEIKTGSLIDFNDNNYGAKFNGYEKFDPVDARYLISYMWVLNDGRVIQDAKLARTPKVPFDVSLDLYKNSISEENRYGNGGHLYVGVNKQSSTKPVLTDFSDFDNKGTVAAVESGSAEFKNKAQAAWKLADDAETIKSITVTIGVSDTEEYKATISGSDIVDGKHITIPYTERRIVYKNGMYYTIPEIVNRDYVLKYDDDNGVWYLNFDKDNEKVISSEGDDFYFNDVENNIRVEVVVTSSKQGYTLTGTKTLTGDKTTFKDNQFSFSLKENAQNDKTGYTGFTGKASLSSNGTITFDTLVFTKPGTYEFTATETGKPSKGYTYDEKPVEITFTVTKKDDGGLSVSPSFKKKGGGDTLSFINKYKDTHPGGGKDNPGSGTSTVKTGDDNNMVLWVLFGGIAIALSVCLAATKKLRNTQKKR